MKALLVAAGLLLAAPSLAHAETAAEAAVAVADAASPAAADDPLSTALIAYGAFHADVSGLKRMSFRRAADAQAALDLVAQSNPDALARGWIAYGALAAAQSPAFVAEVRKVAQAYGRATAIRGFTFGTDYARLLKGGDEAAGLILAAAAADGQRVYGVGQAFRTTALDLQDAAWAKARLPRSAAAPRVRRLVEMAAAGAPRTLAPEILARLSVSPAAFAPASDPTVFGGRSFWDALEAGPGAAQLTAFSPAGQFSANPDQQTAVDAMLSLAALYALDALDEIPAADLDRLLAHDHTSNCFRMAQKQFTQCVSAAASNADMVACVGEAGLQTRAMCVQNVVSVSAAPVTFIQPN